MHANIHSFDFINLVNTLNEKAIAHNNIPKDMTVNSINTVVSITIPPLLYEVEQLSY